MITGVSSLAEAGPGDIAYVESERFAEAARASRAAAFVVAAAVDGLASAAGRSSPSPASPSSASSRPSSPPPAGARGVAREVTLGADVVIGPEPSIWPFVTLGNRVRLGARVTLYPGVFVGDDAAIGDDTILHPNVTVRERCSVGRARHRAQRRGDRQRRLRLRAAATAATTRCPQLGTVVIEDDVELGANVAVDRATFGRTLIRRGTKVDNLVQIAHNVEIGEHTCDRRSGRHLGQHADRLARDGRRAGGLRRSPRGRRPAPWSPPRPASFGTSRPAPASRAARRFRSTRPVPSTAALLRLPDLRRQLRRLEQRVKELEARADAPPKARRSRQR